MARKTLTDKGVAAIKPRAKTYTHSDPMLPVTMCASHQPAASLMSP